LFTNDATIGTANTGGAGQDRHCHSFPSAPGDIPHTYIAIAKSFVRLRKVRSVIPAEAGIQVFIPAQAGTWFSGFPFPRENTGFPRTRE